MLSSNKLEDKKLMREYLTQMLLDGAYDEIPQKIQLDVYDVLAVGYSNMGNGQFREIETSGVGLVDVDALDYFTAKEIALWESEKFYQDVIVAEMDDDDVLDYLERDRLRFL